MIVFLGGRAEKDVVNFVRYVVFVSIDNADGYIGVKECGGVFNVADSVDVSANKVKDLFCK